MTITNKQYKRKKLVKILLLSALALSIINYLIGAYANVNLLSLIEFCVTLLSIFYLDRDFFVEFIYVFIAIVLFAFGVFFCDIQGTYLIEINKFTGYKNALNLALFSNYLLLIGLYFASAHHSAKHKKTALNAITSDQNISLGAKNGTNILYILCFVIVLIEMYVVFELVSRGSSRSLGIERMIYSRTIMSSFSRKIKNNLVLALPLFYHSKGRYKKPLLIIYTSLYVIIMFLSGEKYGPYVRFLYYLLLLYPAIFTFLKKRVYLFVIAAAGLIGVIYSQYSMLYGYNSSMLIIYLQQRLCQQGQLWWAIYDKYVGTSPNINEFIYEIKACYENTLAFSFPYAGQWKMMYLAANGSQYVINKIVNAIPYTMSTISSVYYYFGIAGIIIAYPVFGILYSSIIRRTNSSLREEGVITNVLALKLYIMVDYLFCASDLSALLSVKSLIFILLFALFSKYRFKLGAVLIQ